MQQIKNFSNAFDNIILNLIITFLVFYILCPCLVYKIDVNNNPITSSDQWLAFAIIVLLLKYISENATYSHRFEDIHYALQKENNNYLFSTFILFLVKIMVPVIVTIFIFAFLNLPDKISTIKFSPDYKLHAIIGFALVYIILFLIPDLINIRLLLAYKHSNHKRRKDKPNLNLLFYTVIAWIALSVLVLFIFVIWLVISIDKNNLQHVELTKMIFVYVLIGQSLIDYLINFRFYFRMSF